MKLFLSEFWIPQGACVWKKSSKLLKEWGMIIAAVAQKADLIKVVMLSRHVFKQEMVMTSNLTRNVIINSSTEARLAASWKDWKAPTYNYNVIVISVLPLGRFLASMFSILSCFPPFSLIPHTTFLSETHLAYLIVFASPWYNVITTSYCIVFENL